MFEALYKVGLGDQYLEHLAPWQTMLDQDEKGAPGTVILPEGLSGEFDWHGKHIKLTGGKQRFES